jgi:hypothetical protein
MEFSKTYKGQIIMKNNYIGFVVSLMVLLTIGIMEHARYRAYYENPPYDITGILGTLSLIVAWIVTFYYWHKIKEKQNEI